MDLHYYYYYYYYLNFPSNLLGPSNLLTINSIAPVSECFT